MQLRTVAIRLDFIDPPVPAWRRLAQHGVTRLDVTWNSSFDGAADTRYSRTRLTQRHGTHADSTRAGGFVPPRAGSSAAAKQERTSIAAVGRDCSARQP